MENGFPLKTLEMAATGLPVVSTMLKPLLGLARGIAVTSDHAEFIDGVAASRAGLSRQDRTELIEVARRNDYDVKFDSVLELVAAVAHPPEPSSDSARGKAVIAAWQEHAWPRTATQAIATCDRLRLAFVSLAGGLFPDLIRERVPGRVRGIVNRLLNPR
jgi:hypothetical protein